MKEFSCLKIFEEAAKAGMGGFIQDGLEFGDGDKEEEKEKASNSFSLCWITGH